MTSSLSPTHTHTYTEAEPVTCLTVGSDKEVFILVVPSGPPVLSSVLFSVLWCLQGLLSSVPWCLRGPGWPAALWYLQGRRQQVRGAFRALTGSRPSWPVSWYLLLISL